MMHIVFGELSRVDVKSCGVLVCGASVINMLCGIIHYCQTVIFLCASFAG